MKTSQFVALVCLLALVSAEPIVEAKPRVNAWIDSFIWIYKAFSLTNLLAFFTSGLYMSLSWLYGSFVMTMLL